MALDLPAPDKQRLQRAPLDLVVCQVRYERNLAVGDSKTARAIHDALGGRDGEFPLVDQIQVQNLKVTMGPGVAPSSSEESGWRFSDRDKTWHVTVMADHMSLETTTYETWEGSYRDRLEKAIKAVSAHLDPAFEQRLGLRYIDRITDDRIKEPGDWEKCIEPALLGVPRHEGLGSSVLTAQQLLVLELGEQARCGLRHGFTMGPEEPPTYLLDFDIYREESRPFEVSAIMETADQFNEYALQLFQASVKKEYRESLIS